MSTTAKFQYFKWDCKFQHEKPYVMLMDCPDGFPQKNFENESGPTETVHDLRGQFENFNLDDNGFVAMKQRLMTTNFDEETVNMTYLPSLEQLLKEVLKTECEVFWFDWRVRYNHEKTYIEPGIDVKLDDRSVVLKPIQSAHVDQSEYAAIQRVKHHLGQRAEELLKRRFRILNIWRPLTGIVDDYPLALCDGSSVPDGKLVEVDHVRQSYVGESMSLLQCEQYRWYYINQQTSEDVLIFKMYDSSPFVKAKCCPHSSFCKEGASKEIHRESIEARAIVFTDV